MSHSTPRLRRFQFGLAGLLLSVTVVACVVGAVLHYFRAPEQQFNAGVHAYRAAKYEEAVLGFDRFTAAYPRDRRVPAAQFWRQLAAIRRLSIPEAVAASEALSESRAELISLGLKDEFESLTIDVVAEALQASNQSTLLDKREYWVDLADRGLVAGRSLIYLRDEPNEAVWEDLHISVLLTYRGIARDQALVDALAEISKALSEGDRQAAYSVRQKTIRLYPDLADDPRLSHF